MWTWRWLVSAESLVLLQLPNKNVKVTEIEILNERNLTLVLVLIYKNGKLKKQVWIQGNILLQSNSWSKMLQSNFQHNDRSVRGSHKL